MTHGPPTPGDPYPGGGPPPARRGALFWLLPALLLVGVLIGVYSCAELDGESPAPVATGSSAPAPTGPAATGPTTAPPSPPATPAPAPTYVSTVPGTSGPPPTVGTTAPSPAAIPTQSSPVPVAVEAGSGGLAADPSGSAVRWTPVLAGLLLAGGSAIVLVRRRGPG